MEVDWRRASGPVAADGSLVLTVGGASRTLSGLRNGAATVEAVRLGALRILGRPAGSIRFDEFESRRSAPDGP